MAIRAVFRAIIERGEGMELLIHVIALVMLMIATCAAIGFAASCNIGDERRIALYAVIFSAEIICDCLLLPGIYELQRDALGIVEEVAR